MDSQSRIPHKSGSDGEKDSTQIIPVQGETGAFRLSPKDKFLQRAGWVKHNALEKVSKWRERLSCVMKLNESLII